jgi:anaerobic magnesium-protoporphyrin IX monomethyl ester cyclase
LSVNRKTNAAGWRREKMKKVLMIVLPYLQMKKDVPSSKMKSFPTPPYGALSVATYCKDVADIHMVDCNVDEDYLVTIYEQMVTFAPDIVAFTMMFDNSYNYLEDILKMVKIESCVITVIGGAATLPVYKEILDEQGLMDAVCYCDGEAPFKRLLESPDPRGHLLLDRSWVTRYSLSEGLPPQRSVVDLDDVIDLDYRFINIFEYSPRSEFSPYAESADDKTRFFMFTSHGCPFRCAFCYRSRTKDSKMRYASIDRVINRVKYLVENYGMTYLTICDDQFMIPMDRAKEIFRRLIPFNLRVELYQGSSVAFIDDEMAGLMKAAGMRRVVLPIESGSKEVLEKMVNKPVDLVKAKETVKLLRKHGLWVTALFVLGFPGETDEHRKETLKWIEEAELDWATFSAAVPIRGTKLYDMCLEGGFIEEQKLGKMDYGNYIIRTPGYEPEEVARQIYSANLSVNFVNNYQMRIGDYESAAKAFHWILSVYDKHAFAYYYMAVCMKTLGRDEDAFMAMENFKDIISIDPEWAGYARHFGIGG